MKKALLVFAILIAIGSQYSQAQEIPLKIPASSLGQRIEQDFGLGTISIKYFRPNTKGRKIFNGMEPYGIVWRMGANNATVIKFTDTIKMEGHTVLPGAYALFAIPGEKEFTIILNKNVNQWGAYAYDEKQDTLRFQVTPSKLQNKVETLTLQFSDVTLESCTLQVLWENTALNIHLTADVETRIMANIQEAMKGEKKPYYMSAIWYYNHNKDIQQALTWIKEADKANPGAYNMKYWLARIQLKAGDKAGAIATATEGVRLAKAEPNAEFIRLNQEVLKEAGVK